MIAVICLHFALLLAMGLFRHWGNLNNLYDLGIYDQVVWGTLHGQWFLDTIYLIGRPTNWLGCHFNPILLLFVPFYVIWPAAEWFALAQALALSAAAWPIFLLASRVHGSERTGLLWAGIYLLNPFLFSAAAWDFHPVSLAVPLIATALLAVEQKNFRLLMICCLLLLLIQEQCGITVAGFGVLWALHHREWKSGFLLIAAGLLHISLVLGYIMPALSPTGSHFLIDPGGQHSRYGWLGGSLSAILKNILLHPFWLLTTIVSMNGTVSYFVLLTLPLLGLFFAAPVWLLPALADLAANTLATVTMPRSIIAYHSVTLVPVLTVAAVYGARRIAPLLSKFMSVAVTKPVLLVMAVLCYLHAPLPLPGALNFWQPVHWVQLPAPVVKQIRTLVATSPSLSVQANVGAHFSQHQQVYRFPFKSGEVDKIVLCLESPTTTVVPPESQAIGTLAHHLQMKPAAYLVSIEKLLCDPDYGVILWQEPWLVLSRGGGGAGTDADMSIRNRIDKLRHSWQITAEEYAAALQNAGKQ